jgi:ankyrin repeat protein
MSLRKRGMGGQAGTAAWVAGAVPVLAAACGGAALRAWAAVRVAGTMRVGSGARFGAAMRVSSVALVVAMFGSGAAWAEDSLVDVVQAKNHDAAVALIAKGADVHARSVDGTTALQWAVYNDDADLVERLIKAGADVSATNDYGANPLRQAATVADPVVIKALIKAGADVNAPNAEGETPLMIVARTGNIESAKLLLSHGAKVNAKEQWGGQSALMWAAAQHQPEMVKFLISHGADVNDHGVVRDWQRRVTAEGRPKNENHGGFTPLLYAAREGCIECAKYLIKAKADINKPDPDGTTPLILALMNMRFDMAAYLVSAGADVNKWDFYGNTPLYVAIDMNTLPRGGRPDLPSVDNTTGLQVASMLLEKGADVNAQLKLRPQYRNGVFDRGGDQVLSTGATPLLLAAKVGDLDAIKLLLKYKPLIDLPNAMGVTPLMAAAGLGHSFNPTRGRFKTDEQAAESVKLLQEAGATINGHDRSGMTALHSAAEHGWNDTVKVLVADGADLQPKDVKGLTPIDHAAGRHERAFLEPEHVKHDDTMELLKGYIVAATGKPPVEFAGTLNKSTRGTGGALAN